MPSPKPKPLAIDQLRRRFDPDQVPFDTSDQFDQPPEEVLGQDRAKEALQFGLAMQEQGFHLFVAGPSRTGKTYLVKTYLEKLAQELPPPPDWVYVHNFRQPDEPRCLRLSPGGGRVLAREMDRLVEGLKAKIPEVFESEAYARRKEQITNEFKKFRTQIFSDLDARAREEGYLLRFESKGIMVAPADENGEMMDEKVIREMDDAQREELRRKSDLIQAQVTESLRKIGSLEKETDKAIRELDKQTILFAVGHFFDELLDKYAEQREVLVYLEQVREDIAENYDSFLRKKPEASLPIPMPVEEPNFKEYKVNVFVDNSEADGAPVVVEDHPTFPNLFGRIERQARMGALFTDFTLLRPGALHRANGGFLVLPILEVLQLGLPWEGLKRALRRKRVKMEDPLEQFGAMMTRTLRPDPMPLEIKVILVGEGRIYDLLHAYDPQFSKLFKVRAQMAEHMKFEDEEVAGFISHLSGLAKKNRRLPLDRGAVARLVELAAELAGDRERLTLRLADVADVVAESQFYAQREGRAAVGADEVRQAIKMRRRRSSMLEERMREAVVREFINIDSKGEEVGQINGLFVLDQGDLMFGQPSRISASLGTGKEGVVNIDRESKLSGPIHTKGMLILDGFLRDRFAGKGPITLSASLVFEQSYAKVDGDSASLAELLCLLSRVSGVALRQDLAVTGSVSQKGEVQAIGGVNAKIEGFFRLCQERGFTGSQGVVIPKANLKNLMLPEEIVEVADRGEFSIYAVATVEEAIRIFTGKNPGQPTKSGSYTKNSVYDLVARELKRLREAAKPEDENNKKKKGKGAKK